MLRRVTLLVVAVIGVGCGDSRPPPSVESSSGQSLVDGGLTEWRCPSTPDGGGAADSGADDDGGDGGGADAIAPSAPDAPRIGAHHWPAADIAEADVRMEAGAVVTACFRASRDILWDVHRHDGPDVVYLQRGRARDGEISFRAPAAGLYSFAWTATGGAAVLDVIVVGQGKVEVLSP